MFLSEYRSQRKGRTAGASDFWKPLLPSRRSRRTEFIPLRMLQRNEFRSTNLASRSHFVALQQHKFQQPEQSCQTSIIDVPGRIEFGKGQADDIFGPGCIHETQKHARVNAKGKRIGYGREEGRVEDIAINI